MPIIQIDVREGRSREDIHALQEALTNAVVDHFEAPREYVYVIVREHPGFNHYKAGEHLPEYGDEPEGLTIKRKPLAAE